MFGKRFWWRELPAFVIGTGMMALAVNMVYSPMGMVPGGFSGLAILLSHMLYEYAGIPMAVWSINLLLNIPVFVWGIFEKGHRFIMKSFIANLIFSAMLYAIPEQPVSEGDFVMAAIVGGVLTGAGIGLVFATGYSTGGTDLLGSLICTYYPHISVANVLFVIDSVIIVAGAFYFGIDKAIYATAAVFVSSKVMDAILSGMTQSKQILVISKKWQDIAEEIMTSLNRGVTQIKAKGVYSGPERPVLLCVIGKRQTGQLLQAVRKHDTSAFVIITEAREVLGEGFDSTALGMSADGKKLFKLHRKTTKKP